MFTLFSYVAFTSLYNFDFCARNRSCWRLKSDHLEKCETRILHLFECQIVKPRNEGGGGVGRFFQFKKASLLFLLCNISKPPAREFEQFGCINYLIIFIESSLNFRKVINLPNLKCLLRIKWK
jgi:hypothetical protein